jgi:hypothetical protein
VDLHGASRRRTGCRNPLKSSSKSDN